MVFIEKLTVNNSESWNLVYYCPFVFGYLRFLWSRQRRVVRNTNDNPHLKSLLLLLATFIKELDLELIHSESLLEVYVKVIQVIYFENFGYLRGRKNARPVLAHIQNQIITELLADRLIYKIYFKKILHLTAFIEFYSAIQFIFVLINEQIVLAYSICN